MVNLLQMALPAVYSVVDCQTFEYRNYVGDTVNDFGVVVVSYSAWKTCNGSVQPMDSSMFELLDMDKSKRGILVWGSVPLNTTDIQDHPDQVRWQGRIFNVERSTNWYQANGWHSVGCTEVKSERTAGA